MKRLSVALMLGLGAVGAVQAQSTVSVFGILDANVSRVRSSGNGSLSQLGTDGNLSSRLGFKGTEELGGGLSAGFWLEAALNPDVGTGGTTSANNQATTGSNGGLTFGRRSTVSLQGSFGEIRLGRDYVPGFWNLSAFSAFGTNGLGTSGFLFYPVQANARITNVRASNSVGYFLPDLNGFYGQAMYAWGENASNAGVTADDGRVVGIRLGFAQGPIDVAVATNRTTISTVGDLRQTNIGASYDFGMAKLMALYNENKVGATKTRSGMLGARIPAGPGQVRLTMARVNTTGFTAATEDATHWAAGYVYDLSKRTSLYGDVARISNKHNGTNYNLGYAVTQAGGSSQGVEVGIRHSF